MKDLSKSPNKLSAGIHNLLTEEHTGAVAILSRIVTERNVEGGLTPLIAEAWQLKDVANVGRTLTGVYDPKTTDFAHKEPWKFLFRAVQCAALNNLHLKADLVPDASLAENPRLAAVESIRGLGTQAIEYLGQVIKLETLDYGPPLAAAWDKEVLEKIDALCGKPAGFAVYMARFAGNVAAFQADAPWEAGPPASTKGLFRLHSLAAVAGHDLQLSFTSAGN